MTEQENTAQLVEGLLKAARAMLDTGMSQGTDADLRGCMDDAQQDVARALRSVRRGLAQALMNRTAVPAPRTLSSDIAEDRH